MNGNGDNTLVYSTDKMLKETNCPILGISIMGIGPATCKKESSSEVKNSNYCCRYKCPSPYRICPICTNNGTIDEDSCSKDPITGYCEFHLERGPDKKRKIKVVEETKSHGKISNSWKNKMSVIDKRIEDLMKTGIPGNNKGVKMIPEEEINLGETGNEIIIIPRKNIVPDPNQPRIFFIEKDIDNLAECIKEHGQRVPIEVIKTGKNKYIINDGECRWRACGIAEVETMKCIIIYKINKQRDLHFSSAVFNLHRTDLRPLEISLVIARIRRDYGFSLAKIADRFKKSLSWVQQHNSLLNLHPDVRLLMDPSLPKKKRITFSVAISLAQVKKPKLQVGIANEIVEKGMSLHVARHHIRKTAKEHGIKIGGERTPSNEYNILLGFLERANTSFKTILDFDEDQIKKLFTFRQRGSSDRVKVKNLIRDLKEHLDKLEKAI